MDYITETCLLCCDPETFKRWTIETGSTEVWGFVVSMMEWSAVSLLELHTGSVWIGQLEWNTVLTKARKSVIQVKTTTYSISTTQVDTESTRELFQVSQSVSLILSQQSNHQDWVIQRVSYTLSNGENSSMLVTYLFIFVQRKHGYF